MKGTALVTGSAHGIGRALAVALAGEGYGVAVHCRRSVDEAETTARQCEALGVPATVLQADVTDPGQARELVRRAHAAFAGSPLAVLVNNVGNYVQDRKSVV